MTATARVKNGFRTAGAWLLGMAWLALVFAGLAIAFSPSKYPPIVGRILLITAAVALVATADWWVMALPGILGVATINSIVTISTGHATNNPSVPISHSQAIAATILLAGSTVLSLDFRARKLNFLDRMSLLIYASCLAWGAIQARVTYLAAGIATFCLLFAWTYNRFQTQHNIRKSAFKKPAVD